MIGQKQYNLIIAVFGGAGDKEKQSSKSCFLQQPFNLSLMSEIIKPQHSIKTGATLVLRHSAEKPILPELSREAFARLALVERQPLGEFKRARTNDIRRLADINAGCFSGGKDLFSSPKKAIVMFAQMFDK